eukprot:scaffold60785_cov36-Tisochrysis_lutea.AAC.3
MHTWVRHSCRAQSWHQAADNTGCRGVDSPHIIRLSLAHIAIDVHESRKACGVSREDEANCVLLIGGAHRVALRFLELADFIYTCAYKAER